MRSEQLTKGQENSNTKNKCCSNSGGCNKLDTFDYLEDKLADDPMPLNIFEVSFKSGSRKDFYFNANDLDIHTGDWIVVNTGSGYDVGQVSLSGELVRLQMKKKRVKSDKELLNILRKASERDLEKLTEVRSMERAALKKAKEIANSLNLEMKLGDVEYQADRRKATFYYTADGRIDFRELVKYYAKEFRVKIEMRQIGIRQESSRIGGVASCGRELCCSSWLTNFSSVTTETARYQNLAINQSKLTGLCGRLKCCLNFELDTYMEALEEFPKDAERVYTKQGTAYLIKMDIFKGLLYYSIKDENGRNRLYALHKDDIGGILEMNKNGEKVDSLGVVQYINEDLEEDVDFEDVTGQIELPDKKTKRRGKSRKKRPSSNRNRDRRKKQGDNAVSSQKKEPQGEKNEPKKSGEDREKNVKNQKSRPPRRSGNRRNKRRNNSNKPGQQDQNKS